MISLLGMLLMGIGFVGGLGITASVTVAVTVAASITLLPALLGFAGDNIERTKWRGLVAAGFVAVALVGAGLGDPRADRASASSSRCSPSSSGSSSRRCKREVQHRPPKPRRETARLPLEPRHPAPPVDRRPSAPPRSCSCSPSPCSACGSGSPTRATSPTTRRPSRPTTSSSRASARAPPGPIYLVAAVDGADQVGALAAVNDAVAADPEVESILGPAAQRPGRTRPRSAGSSPRRAARRTRRPPQLVNRLRDDVLPPVEQAAGADVLVSGLVAAQRRHVGLHGRADADLLRRRARAVVPAADGRVPVAARAAQGRDHEPAVDRRRLRRDRRPVPVGLAQRPHRRAARARSRRGCR